MWYGYGDPHDAQRPGAQVTSSDGCCRKNRVKKAIPQRYSRVLQQGPRRAWGPAFLALPTPRVRLFLGGRWGGGIASHASRGSGAIEGCPGGKAFQELTHWSNGVRYEHEVMPLCLLLTPSIPTKIPEAVVPRRGGARPLGVLLARSAAPCSSQARRRRSASASAAFRTASSSSCSCSRCSSADTRSSTSMPLVPDRLSSRKPRRCGLQGTTGWGGGGGWRNGTGEGWGNAPKTRRVSGFSGSVGDQPHSLLFLQPGADEDARRWAEEEGSGKEEGNPHLLSLPQCPDHATLGEIPFFHADSTNPGASLWC